MSFEVGQEVVRRGRERYGKDITGTVIKVARKFCTVEFEREALGYSFTAEFDKETGIERGDRNYPQRLAVIKTAEEWAAIDRSDALVAALRSVGIEFSYRAKLLPERIIEAIAEVVGIYVVEEQSRDQ
jgi:hypothetical protein